MNLKHYLMASAILSAATLAGGLASAAPCPNINGVTTCNVVITAGPGGSFATTIPNPNPYDGSDDNLVGVINNSGSTITSLSFVGSGNGGGLFAFDGDGLQSYVPADGSDPTGYGGRVSTTANFDTSGPAELFHQHPHDDRVRRQRNRRFRCERDSQRGLRVLLSGVGTEHQYHAGDRNPGACQPRASRRRPRRSRFGTPPPEARLKLLRFGLKAGGWCSAARSFCVDRA